MRGALIIIYILGALGCFFALCDHDWSDAERHIAAALRSAHASGLSETTAIAQRWRNDMAEACACIAERYEAHGPAADMRAMIRSLGAKE